MAYNLQENSKDMQTCVADCMPINWTEYLENTASGLYWEGASEAPLYGVNMTFNEYGREGRVVQSIRDNSKYYGAQKDDPFIDTLKHPFSDIYPKSKILCDLTPDQVDDDFGNFDFETSYVVVDGVVFVPSIRYQKATSTKEGPMCTNEKSRMDLINNRETYITKEGSPCSSCLDKCDKLHPTTFTGLLNESVQEIASGLLAGITEITGIDPSMLKYIVMGIVLIYLYAVFYWPTQSGNIAMGLFLVVVILLINNLIDRFRNSDE